VGYRVANPIKRFDHGSIQPAVAARELTHPAATRYEDRSAGSPDAPRTMRQMRMSGAVGGDSRSAQCLSLGVPCPGMDWKIELVAIPVTDVDRAKAFYVDQVGFHADHDHQVNEELRFVQLTPPGSACSIVMGTGITEMAPGSQKGVQIVVADVEAARQQLLAHGVQASDVDVQPWGSFVTFGDPDGNTWALQQLPSWR
jgi:catechol 2,3-dioxygenase-like lactoylglutathione lyase family enzyme